MTITIKMEGTIWHKWVKGVGLTLQLNHVSYRSHVLFEIICILQTFVPCFQK